MTDKGVSLVSKSLPVANLNSVNRLFSARRKKYYDSPCGTLYVCGCRRPSPRRVVGVESYTCAGQRTPGPPAVPHRRVPAPHR